MPTRPAQRHAAPAKDRTAPAQGRSGPAAAAPESMLAEFERIYRDHVRAVTAFFARRCREPETVSDLTAETFTQAMGSFATFDPRRGPVAGWLFGIARRVYARHCARSAEEGDATGRLAGRRPLHEDEFEELAARIDAERRARRLLEGLAELPALEREAIALVDLDGLHPREAAAALQVTPGALRVRLFRARTRLRKRGAGT